MSENIEITEAETVKRYAEKKLQDKTLTSLERTWYEYIRDNSEKVSYSKRQQIQGPAIFIWAMENGLNKLFYECSKLPMNQQRLILSKVAVHVTNRLDESFQKE